MYLHLGNGFLARDEDVVGIFDLDNTTGSRITRDFLTRAEKAGNVVNTAEDIPRSFVVCAEKRKKKRTRLYLSQLSPATLLKRSAEDIL